MRDARHNWLIAGQIGNALAGYEASLSRGEKPEMTADVYAALALRGLSHGKDILFADEARKLEQDRKRQARR